MWMLVAHMCLQMSATEPECVKTVRPPVSDAKECRALIRPTQEYLFAMADELGADVLFISAGCVKGRDV